MRSSRAALPGVAMLCIALPGYGRAPDVRPEVSLEARAFPDNPQFEDQFATSQLGVVLTWEDEGASANKSTPYEQCRT